MAKHYIKLTGKTKIPSRTGCQWHDDCEKCPEPICYMDMKPTEKRAFRKQKQLTLFESA